MSTPPSISIPPSFSHTSSTQTTLSPCNNHTPWDVSFRSALPAAEGLLSSLRTALATTDTQSSRTHTFLTTTTTAAAATTSTIATSTNATVAGGHSRLSSSLPSPRGLPSDDESPRPPARPSLYPNSHRPQARLDGLEARRWGEREILDTLRLEAFEGLYNLCSMLLVSPI